MKSAATVFAIGLLLTAFGLLVDTVGGPCRVENCGVPLNTFAFFTGIGIMAIAVVYGVWRRTRRA
jgi:hypothetical protein